MTAMDEFTALQAMQKEMDGWRWGATVECRFFTKNFGSNTERHLSGAMQAVFKSAMNVTEHVGSSAISYASSYALGSAAQKVVNRYIDNELKNLAEQAKTEARAVMTQLSQNQE